ncbi:uncharacterized protein [Antedon mediterranea]|uniref:uncharacterized protein n=1 Tax=Antedon mediterranea TaxID=105859 RepID=UPI003AF95E28
MLAGDVHPCPGPTGGRKPKCPCIVCSKGIIKTSRAISYDNCDRWSHINCINFPLKKYTDLCHSGEEFAYECQECVFRNLPFSNADVNDTSNDHRDIDTSTLTNDSCDDPDTLLSEIFRCKGLHYLHLNTKSLLPKIDEIRSIAKKTDVSLIAISESWLDKSVNNSEISIDNYSIERKDRCTNSVGGGVCLYIRNDLTYNVRDDLQNDDIESLWINILLPKTKPILIGTCYRPEKQRSFFTSLETICGDILQGQEVIILGDFNVDVSSNNLSKNKWVSQFCNMFNLTQLIKDPTRITCTTSTIIDLIFSSEPLNIFQYGVIPYGVSDHFITYCTRKIVKIPIKRHKTIKIRSMKSFSSELLTSKLNELDWSDITNCTNVCTAWDWFKLKMINAINQVAPLKEIRIKQRSKPWFTSEIRYLIIKRDKCLAKFKRTRNEHIFTVFKKLRNSVKYKIKRAKSSYFSDKLKENKNNPNKLWNVLTSLGTGTENKSENIALKCEDKIIYDKSSIADYLNSFFINTPENLVNKLPPSSNTYNENHVKHYYADKKGVFAFKEVNEQTVLTIINNLNSKKGAGLDSLPARFFKDGALAILHPLSHIINISISTGYIPSDWKSAKVVPIYKKKDRLYAGNYRPVSILSAVSKIIERIMYNQLMSYLNDQSLLYTYQSGFRPSFSTETCLIHLSDSVRNGWDKGKMTGMIIIDLQKAFDTVDHDILLYKLKAMGFTSLSLSWMQSYLHRRSQVVDIKGTKSTFLDVKCGVP